MVAWRITGCPLYVYSEHVLVPNHPGRGGGASDDQRAMQVPSLVATDGSLISRNVYSNSIVYSMPPLVAKRGFFFSVEFTVVGLRYFHS